MKVLAAPDLRCEGHARQLIDWGPAALPFSEKSLLAAALQDIVYVQDLSKSSTSHYQSLDTVPHCAVALCFDKYGEAIAIGQTNGKTVIFDVEKEQKLRVIESPGVNVI